MLEGSIEADVRKARAQLLEAAGGSIEGLVRLLSFATKPAYFCGKSYDQTPRIDR
jgi:hypothetical protein